MCMDLHFVKGHSHDICEDYGLIDQDNKFMIVADGCSTGRYSDVSSRILVHCCKNEILRYLITNTIDKISYSFLRYDVLSSAVAASKVMSLGDLLSTLIIAFKANDQVHVYMYGDGYIVYKRKSDSAQIIIKVTFNKNAPYYMWYCLNPDRFVIHDADLVESHYENGEFFGRVGISREHQLSYLFDCSDLEYIGILTDGVDSFVSNKPKEDSLFGSNISDINAIKHLFDFKNTNGDFVKRRMNRFVKQIQNDGFLFGDDMSCAVMLIE